MLTRPFTNSWILPSVFFQGQELTIRQIALLGFRDLVLLKVKLNEILPLVRTKLPASIVQMLLILQVGSLCSSSSDSTWVPRPHWTNTNPGKERGGGRGCDEGEVLHAYLEAVNVEMRSDLNELSWEQVRMLLWKGWVLLFGVCIFLGTSPPQLETVSGLFFSHKFSSPSFSECLFVPLFFWFLSFAMTGRVSTTADCGIWTSRSCWLSDVGPLAGWDAEQCPWEEEYLLAAGKMLYIFKKPLPRDPGVL